MEYSNLFVVAMGVGTVFVGLISLILLVSLMGRICRKPEKQITAPPAAAAMPPANKNSEEILAAVSAAIAEELNADVSAIRIVSIQRIQSQEGQS